MSECCAKKHLVVADNKYVCDQCGTIDEDTDVIQQNPYKIKNQSINTVPEYISYNVLNSTKDGKYKPLMTQKYMHLHHINKMQEYKEKVTNEIYIQIKQVIHNLDIPEAIIQDAYTIVKHIIKCNDLKRLLNDERLIYSIYFACMQNKYVINFQTLLPYTHLKKFNIKVANIIKTQCLKNYQNYTTEDLIHAYMGRLNIPEKYYTDIKTCIIEVQHLTKYCAYSKYITIIGCIYLYSKKWQKMSVRKCAEICKISIATLKDRIIKLRKLYPFE